jgi:integrase
MLGLHAGLRREEIRFLTWKDIDLTGAFLRVTAKPPGFSPKNHEERTVPLNQDILAYLRELRAAWPDAEWVCLNCEFGQWSLGLTKWSRELFNAAGIERDHGTLHRLRHTFGTRLLHAGVDIETVRDLMGHADISTTGRYLSTTDPRKRAAVALLAAQT